MNYQTRLRVLIVDDDETFRTLAETLLRDHCEIVTARSGFEAIGILKTSQIDAVFSDVCMEEGSGVEILNWVQKTRTRVSPPVVLVTGQATITRDEAYEQGAFAVIGKPFRLHAYLDVFHDIRRTRLKLSNG